MFSCLHLLREECVDLSLGLCSHVRCIPTSNSDDRFKSLFHEETLAVSFGLCDQREHDVLVFRLDLAFVGGVSIPSPEGTVDRCVRASAAVIDEGISLGRVVP